MSWMEQQIHDLEIADLSTVIHQGALNPYLDLQSINHICDVSKELNFSGLTSNLIFLPKIRRRLGQTNKTKLIAVIAFPFGTIPNHFKESEAEWAISQGAEELEVVPNFYALKQKKVNLFAEELSKICELGFPVRSILNMDFLSKEELSLAVDASIEAGVIGVQTGNGFGRVVSKEDIAEIKGFTRQRCEIKAVGRLKTLSQAIEVIEAGATIVGTTAGPEIMQSLKKTNDRK